MSDIIEFSGNLRSFAETLRQPFAKIMRYVAADLWNKITVGDQNCPGNPVDTGWSRSNWRLGIGSPDETVSGTRPAEGTPQIEAPEADPTQLVQIDGTQKVYITNAVNYVQYLEEGTSKQAPSGFIRIAVAAEEATIEDILQRAKEAQ